MQKEPIQSLNSDEWVTIREFIDGNSGHTLPRYEAKLLEDVDKEYLESELVLVRETHSRSQHSRMYQFPVDVFEDIGTRLASRDG
jgi:hypothetical protein